MFNNMNYNDDKLYLFYTIIIAVEINKTNEICMFFFFLEFHLIFNTNLHSTFPLIKDNQFLCWSTIHFDH